MQKQKNWIFVVLAAGLVILAVMLLRGGETPVRPPELAYTDYKVLIAEGEIDAIKLEGEVATANLRRPLPLGPNGAVVEAFQTRIPAFGDPAFLKEIEARDVGLTIGEDKEKSVWSSALVYVLPWLLFIGVYVFLMRRMWSGMRDPFRGQAGKFLTAGSDKTLRKPPKVRFADVAGQDAAKREVKELVDFLREPERYTRLGAEVPHGILLMGPPGTGKTLLAKALAGEARVPFFSISASEFIEVFVGVGASRVRHMFEEAKKRAPSIIFIDELDSIGRVRGAGFGGGHDEREQTLNQILAELDGFESREAVVVLAATNRPDVLDPALLRPGRFDRHVTLDLPDQAAREAILKVHTKTLPLADDVDLLMIAKETPGFSGADLKNLANEAAMLAARKKTKTITADHFDETRDRLLMGTVRTLAIVPEERHRLAVHKAGHVVAAHFLPHADPLYKVTIIPRGRALGGTHQLPDQERHTLPEDYLRDRLAVMLGGRATEKVLLGTVSSGADDDIHQASALARAMVARWGMDETVGPVDVRQSEEHPFLGREFAQPRYFSETTAHAVDEAIRRLLVDAEDRVVAIIETHRPALDRLIGTLEDQESLDRDAIDACLEPAASRRPVVVERVPGTR